MKVYLDNCCFNRPYDDQSHITISIETQAKIKIQEEIVQGKHDLVSSYVIRFENSQNPFQNRREATESFLEENAKEYVGAERSNQIMNIAKEIMATGIKEYDALHIACASYANCDFFITTDRRLLRYISESTPTINPVDFIRLEDKDNE